MLDFLINTKNADRHLNKHNKVNKIKLQAIQEGLNRERKKTEHKQKNQLLLSEKL